MPLTLTQAATWRVHVFDRDDKTDTTKHHWHNSEKKFHVFSVFPMNNNGPRTDP